MYIAFRWLLGLSLIMWISLCYIDIFSKRSSASLDIKCKAGVNTFLKNATKSKIIPNNVTANDNIDVLQYLMFLAGAFVVIVFNKKHEIYDTMRMKLSQINLTYFKSAIIQVFQKISNAPVIRLRVTTMKIVKPTWAKLLQIRTHFIKMCLSILDVKTDLKQKNINILLLNKLEEMVKEKGHLSKLLLASIHKNKSIKNQYDLEMLAKNRLLKRIEETQRDTRLNRIQHFNFQQLYLICNKENAFLKALIRKLTSEKVKAENTLMALVGEIFTSKNKDLKVYCSSLIVKTDHNLLNGDVNAEIQKFVTKSKTSECSLLKPNLNSNTNINHRPDIQCSDGIVPLVTKEFKSNGLSGKCVWTIKDKDGFIEKLYEYDCHSSRDNGDSIRVIREYTVYHEKDCYIDEFSSRNAALENASCEINHFCGTQTINLTSQKFLTGSEVFKKFLKTNLNFENKIVKK